MNIFLSVSFNICFGCSKEQSHWDGSLECPQHMFWLKIRKSFFLYTLIKRPRFTTTSNRRRPIISLRDLKQQLMMNVGWYTGLITKIPCYNMFIKLSNLLFCHIKSIKMFHPFKPKIQLAMDISILWTLNQHSLHIPMKNLHCGYSMQVFYSK